MSTPNYLAVLGMCAIVITLYAIRDSHQDYLADLFGLALALAQPKQSYAVGAVVIAFIIRHTSISHGLAGFLPLWLVPVILPAARDMSISEQDAAAAEAAYKDRVLDTDQDEENEENPQPVAEKEDQKFIAAQVAFAAKAVASGALGMTEATRLAAGVNSGRKYSKYSRLIKAEMQRLENHYRDLDSKRQQVPPDPN